MGNLVSQFQGQILRAAANNTVCGHAKGCVYAPTSPMRYTVSARHLTCTTILQTTKVGSISSRICPCCLSTESPHKFPNLYRGSFDCLRSVVRDKGWRGPFKGLGLTVARDSTGFCIYILMYQYICDLLTPEVNQASAGR